jgi:hypothetical protein
MRTREPGCTVLLLVVIGAAVVIGALGVALMRHVLKDL